MQSIDKATIAPKAPAKSEATKDAGRVRIGAGAIDFSETRDSTKDAGRVRMGAGAINF